MARVIVRVSLQRDQVRLRNQVVSTLERAGFSRIGTSTFEAENIELVQGALAVSVVVKKLGTARLDHLWIYVDEPEPGSN